MKPHHIGCVVSDIDASVAEHLATHKCNVTEKVLVTEQKVWVCFAELQPGFYIEFIQPAEEGSVVDRLLRKGISYYHIGYKTSDISKEIAALENQGYKLLNRFRSEAFNGKECAFLFGSDSRLLELIQE